MKINLSGNTVGSQQSIIQQNIILGTLLGDGFLERNGRYCRLIIDHSSKQKDYLLWKSRYLDTFFPKIIQRERYDSRTNRTYSHCIMRTRTSVLLERFRDIFYSKEKKNLPKDLPKVINWMILAVWIMDDGYKRNDCRAFRLNTQGYSFEEQQIVQKSLGMLGIDTVIQRHKNSFCIYIPSKSFDTVVQGIKKFIIPSMSYKIA